jgi:hypothetical protein
MTRRRIAIVAALIAFIPITVRGQKFISDYTPGHGNPMTNQIQRLNTQTTTVGSQANDAENSCQSWTLPANTLAADGQSIRITAHGYLNGNGHPKTMRLYWGSSLLIATPAASISTQFEMEGVVTRVGHGGQAGFGKSFTGTTGVTTTLSNRISGAEDETQPILIRATTQVTGGAVVNEAKCDVLLIEFMP